MQFIFVLLLGWGGTAAYAGRPITPRPPLSVPADSKVAPVAPTVPSVPMSAIVADADSRCAESLKDASTLAKAKRAARRVLVVDESLLNHELYSAYMLHYPAPSHQPEREIFVYNAFGIEAGQEAIKWAQANQVMFDVVFTAGVFPEADNASQGSDGSIANLFAPARGPLLPEPTGVPAYGLITAIRERSPRTRIIVLSVWSQAAVLARQRRVGSKHVQEPHVWHELLISREDMLHYVFAEVDPDPVAP